VPADEQQHADDVERLDEHEHEPQDDEGVGYHRGEGGPQGQGGKRTRSQTSFPSRFPKVRTDPRRSNPMTSEMNRAIRAAAVRRTGAARGGLGGAAEDVEDARGKPGALRGGAGDSFGASTTFETPGQTFSRSLRAQLRGGRPGQDRDLDDARPANDRGEFLI
jgi:hypothetical protein